MFSLLTGFPRSHSPGRMRSETTGSEGTANTEKAEGQGQLGLDRAERPRHLFLPSHGALEPCALNSKLVPDTVKITSKQPFTLALPRGVEGQGQHVQILQEGEPWSQRVGKLRPPWTDLPELPSHPQAWC